jgi:hypothetical protein
MNLEENGDEQVCENDENFESPHAHELINHGGSSDGSER